MQQPLPLETAAESGGAAVEKLILVAVHKALLK